MNNKISKQLLPEAHILRPLLAESAKRHRHLCPRQVLGVRMGLYGLRLLGFVDTTYQPRFENKDKQLLTIVETDGCGADGVAVATSCYVGRRTLRVVDYGKVAATFIDTQTSFCWRISPHPQARTIAQQYVPHAESHWHAYLEAYQRLPDTTLLIGTKVALTQSIETILSRPNARVQCAICCEEVMNEREVLVNGRALCRSCAGERYYTHLDK